MKKNYLIGAISLSLVIAVSAYAKNSAKAPEENHGLSVDLAHQHKLGDQIPTMKGYELRGRKITVAPGGATSEHSHTDRPGMVYVLEGMVIEYRGGVERKMSVGDSFVEAADTVHWLTNPTDKPAIIVAVDLVPQK